MTLFYFLRGALGEGDLLREHEVAIQSLLEGDYAKADVERLKGHKGVYSLRLNQQARLLFTLHSVKGENYLLVLDYLPTHDYDKSRFLKNGVLQQYLNKQEEAYTQVMQEAEQESLFEKISSQNFEGLISSLQTEIQNHGLAQNQRLDRSVLDFYQYQWIELNREQQEILELTLPTVLTGVAGSGKSCIALSLLSGRVKSYLRRNVYEAQDEKEDSPSMLYITETPKLAAEMESFWKALPIARDTQGWVRFLTYQQLLQELVEFPEESVWVGFEEFTTWYDNYYLDREKNQAKLQKKSPNPIPSHLLYQEFRIASGYNEEQCDQKKTLYADYQRYVNGLRAQKKIDPALYALPLKNRYDLIVADEVQNFSPGQLTILNNLAKKKAFAAFGDPHQDTANHRPVFPFLWSLLDIKKDQRKELQLTHRSPSQVVGIANEILSFKRDLFGGLRYKGESSGIKAMTSKHQGGEFFLIREEQLDSCPWLQEAPKGSNFAVVTCLEYQEQAKKCFNTEFVFTPKQIKGLEFSFVLVFRLFPHYDQLFDYAFQRIKKLKKLGQKASINQAKEEDKAFDEFLNQINEIYTLCTRTTQILVLCREITAHNAVFFDRLSSLAVGELPAEFLLSPANSAEDWRKQILTLYRSGNPYNATLALSLFQSNLSEVYKQTFEEFLIQHDLLSPPAVAKSSASLVEVVVSSDPKKLTIVDPSITSDPPRGKRNQKMKKKLNRKEEKTKLLDELFQTEERKSLGKIQAEAMALYKNFIETRLSVALRIYDPKALFLDSLLNEPCLNLFEYCLVEPDTAKKLLACLGNNLDILVKFPLDYFLNKMKGDLTSSKRKGSLKEGALILAQGLMKFKGFQSTLKGSSDMDMNEKTLLGVLIVSSQKAEKNESKSRVLKETILLFQEWGIDINKLDKKGRTPVAIAALSGDVIALRVLLQEFSMDPNSFDLAGTTPANLAISNGHDEVLDLLHEFNADLERPDTIGISPASLAVVFKSKKTLSKLYELGVDLHDPTLLYLAIDHDFPEGLNYLISIGSNLNQPLSKISPKIFATTKYVFSLSGNNGSLMALGMVKGSREIKEIIHSYALARLNARGGWFEGNNPNESPIENFRKEQKDISSEKFLEPLALLSPEEQVRRQQTSLRFFDTKKLAVVVAVSLIPAALLYFSSLGK